MLAGCFLTSTMSRLYSGSAPISDRSRFKPVDKRNGQLGLRCNLSVFGDQISVGKASGNHTNQPTLSLWTPLRHEERTIPVAPPAEDEYLRFSETKRVHAINVNIKHHSIERISFGT